MKKLFSLFALVGAFVACQPEELETAFLSRGLRLIAPAVREKLTAM